MKNIKVEIVTSVYNRRSITLQFLKSLSRIDRRGLEIHTIVVDDGSTDGTEDAVREQFPEVEIIKGDGNLWYTAGTNRGIEAAIKYEPDYVLCVNNDSIFEEKSVRAMVECAQTHPGSVIGALLLLWDQPHRIFQVSPEWKTTLGGWRHWYKQTIWTVPKKPWRVELIVGNCVLFPVRAIKQCGLMDEKRLVQYGDAEYTPRMRKKGWQLLIEPGARVFCKPNDVPPRLRRMPLKKLFTTLFLDKYNPHGLRRRFYVNLLGAPNKLQGILAFFIFFLRVFLGKSIEKNDLSEEPPLAEKFADKMVT